MKDHIDKLLGARHRANRVKDDQPPIVIGGLGVQPVIVDIIVVVNGHQVYPDPPKESMHAAGNVEVLPDSSFPGGHAWTVSFSPSTWAGSTVFCVGTTRRPR